MSEPPPAPEDDLPDRRSPSADELFDATVDLPPDERDRYLREACPDPDLRREVESLLAADDEAGAGGFLGGELLSHSRYSSEISPQPPPRHSPQPIVRGLQERESSGGPSGSGKPSGSGTSSGSRNPSGQPGAGGGDASDAPSRSDRRAGEEARAESSGDPNAGDPHAGDPNAGDPGADPAEGEDRFPGGNAGPTTSAFDGPRFRILGRHRRGGLGEVFVALDRQLNREVAIKQVRSRWRGHDEARQRFLQEAEITGRLEHPGVVPVYAMGKWDDGLDYYAMRFIEGQTLRDAIDRYHAARTDTRFDEGPGAHEFGRDGVTPDDRGSQGGADPEGGDASGKGRHVFQGDFVKGGDPEQSYAMEFRKLVRRFIDVCDTIEYAHSRRVLHRDIKPSNVMLGPYGETLVVDWGLAKLLDTPSESSMTIQFLRGSSGDDSGSTPTAIGGTVGTPQFMSPEQASGAIDEIGIPTDLFLLGGTLFYLLTGHPPHAGASIQELIGQARLGVARSPQQVFGGVPAPLDAICMKAMATRPADRYRSAAALAADLERWIADEPVSVYRDPLAVRAARWLRRRRAAAYSFTVAAALLVVGSVAGSIIYGTQNARRLVIERERNEKESELRTQRERRLAERRTAAAAAERFATEEILFGRFPSGLGFVEGALEAVGDEPVLSDQRARLVKRRDELGRLVDFYELAARSQRANILSRDTRAIMACRASLDAVGMWASADWWRKLPDPGLSPEQLDELRWDVYQQLATFDGLLVKRMGAQLAGDDWGGGEIPFWTLMRRVLRSTAGRTEARSAVLVSDRIHAFRLAEAARWYRSAAAFRLGEGKRIHGYDLEPPRNATDALSLGLLSLVASQDTGFASFFDGYQGDDPLTTSRDLFLRSVMLRPEHYPAQLSLGLTEYLTLQHDLERRSDDAGIDWRAYDPILKTFGNCVTIGPDECFAYADRSSIYRFQADAIADDATIPEQRREQMRAERLRRSLTDAEAASERGADQPWVDWHYGLSLDAAGQFGHARERLLRASRLTLPLGASEDASLLRVDDLRGRAEVVERFGEVIADDPGDARSWELLASVRLNQDRLEDAVAAADRAIKADDSLAHAFAVRGMADVRRGQAAWSQSNVALVAGDRVQVLQALSEADAHFLAAEPDLNVCLERDPRHVWACFGKACCDEQAGRGGDALEGYRRAEAFAVTQDHRAAALLGQARMLAVEADFDAARNAVDAAREIAPACDVMSVVFPLTRRLAMSDPPAFDNSPAAMNSSPAKDSSSIDSEPASTRDRADVENELLKNFLRSLSELPRPATIPLRDGESDPTPRYAALLDGGFELPLGRYWGDESGAIWANRGGYDSLAVTTDRVAHAGTRSLHLRGGESKSPRERFASMGQSFPVLQGESYELRFWARARSLGEGAVRFESGDGELIAEVPPGSYEWTQVRSRFVPDVTAPEGAGRFAELRLNLVSAGPGDAWIDEIEVALVVE